MQRHQLEVDGLHERPDHPVLLERGRVCAFQLVLRAGALHDGHAAEEDKQVGAGKDGLVASHAGNNLEVLVLEDDLVLQELEPGRSGGTEDGYVPLALKNRWIPPRGIKNKLTATVQCHAAGTRQFVILPALLLNQLLCHRVAGRKEHGGRDALGQDRARRQLHLVPRSKLAMALFHRAKATQDTGKEGNIPA
jgi:hypothetical protein